MKINYISVVSASVAAFIFSSVYYSPLLIGNIWRAVDPRALAAGPSFGKILVEVARTIVISVVLARLIEMTGRTGWKAATGLALLLWFGFSAMMWVGAVLWEGTPLSVAAIHSGDWLIKTLLMCVILGSWRPGGLPIPNKNAPRS